jgi:hypothetical protein
MKHSLLLILAALSPLALVQCASMTPVQTAPEPGQGAIALVIVPNPIVAERVSGSRYDFPFEVRISNPGSLPVTLEEIRIDVTALGGVRIHSDTMDATEIARRGYPTRIAAGETLSYHFSPRQDVPDDRLFSGVSALLTASGRDSSGKGLSASLSVSVR